LAKKKRLPVDLVLPTVATLPVTVVEQKVSASSIPEAIRRIGQRDPDDVELLARALHLDLPIWSNDDDFEVARVEWYTTAELLKKLGI
jgi:predicted nucleic acid-binding protein